MRLVYFAPSDIQVARVDRQCIVNFCDALQEIGVDVELVAIRVSLHDRERAAAHPLDQYRIRRRFPVRLVRVPVHQSSAGWWRGLNRLLVHSVVAARELAGARTGDLCFYVKNFGPLAVMLALARLFGRGRCLVAFEAHVPPSSTVHRWLLRRCPAVIANTSALAHDLVEHNGLDRERVLGVHQGVDLDLIDAHRLSPLEARVALGLPLDRRLVVYTGKVYRGYEEVELILQAAARMSRNDVEFLIVGGRADHVDTWREQAAVRGLVNVRFTGFVAPNRVHLYQFAADALLLYYPSGLAINRYRSPGKLFEYMASMAPIVSVDLPVLREVLGDPPAAFLVPQDEPASLARTITAALEDEGQSTRLAATAHERVRAFTWLARAQSVAAFLMDRVRISTPNRQPV